MRYLHTQKRGEMETAPQVLEEDRTSEKYTLEWKEVSSDAWPRPISLHVTGSNRSLCLLKLDWYPNLITITEMLTVVPIGLALVVTAMLEDADLSLVAFELRKLVQFVQTRQDQGLPEIRMAFDDYAKVKHMPEFNGFDKDGRAANINEIGYGLDLALADEKIKVAEANVAKARQGVAAIVNAANFGDRAMR